MYTAPSVCPVRLLRGQNTDRLILFRGPGPTRVFAAPSVAVEEARQGVAAGQAANPGVQDGAHAAPGPPGRLGDGSGGGALGQPPVRSWWASAQARICSTVSGRRRCMPVPLSVQPAPGKVTHCHAVVIKNNPVGKKIPWQGVAGRSGGLRAFLGRMVRQPENPFGICGV
jgi:hypothetical protein